MSTLPFYSNIQIQTHLVYKRKKNESQQNKQKQKRKQNKCLSSQKKKKKSLIKPAMLIRMDTRHTQTYRYKTIPNVN